MEVRDEISDNFSDDAGDEVMARSMLAMIDHELNNNNNYNNNTNASSASGSPAMTGLGLGRYKNQIGEYQGLVSHMQGETKRKIEESIQSLRRSRADSFNSNTDGDAADADADGDGHGHGHGNSIGNGDDDEGDIMYSMTHAINMGTSSTSPFDPNTLQSSFPALVPTSSSSSATRVKFDMQHSVKTDYIASFVFLGLSLLVLWLELFDFSAVPLSRKENSIVVLSCVISAAIGVAVLFCCLYIAPKILLSVSEVAAIGSLLLLSLIHMVSDEGSLKIALTLLGVSCFFGVWLYHHHTKKEFGAVLFEMAATLILDNRSIIVVFFACLFVQTFWLIAFAITCVQAFSNTYYHLIYTLLFVGYVWTVGVLEHIIHAVVAEALCRWYFKVDHGAVPPLHSVYHSIKQSFGSICLAALCIPPVKLLWGIMRPLSRVKQRSLTGLFERPYLWAETLYTYNNQYCFPKMIMYNMDFRSASGAVYRQFYERSVDSIVWYVKFSTLLFFPQIGGGCLLASITALWAKSAQVEHWYIISVTAFFVGYSTLALTTAVVGGVIHTVLACFAEFPQLLAETHPIIFHRFVRISEFSTFQDNRMDI